MACRDLFWYFSPCIYLIWFYWEKNNGFSGLDQSLQSDFLVRRTEKTNESVHPSRNTTKLFEPKDYPLEHVFNLTKTIAFDIRTGWSQPTWRCICQWPAIARLHATPNCWVGTLRRPTIGDLSAATRVPRLCEQNSRQILRDRFGQTRSHRRQQTESCDSACGVEDSGIQGGKSVYFRVGNQEQLVERRCLW